MLTLAHSQRLRYVTFFWLYVMQGLPAGLSLIALTNYLAAKGVAAQSLATFGTVVGLPWGVKFLWGPLIDRFQASAMGRRRPWVLGAQVMAFLSSLGMVFVADPVNNIDQLMWCFALHGVFASLQDVSVDALAITVVPASERGRVNALMKGGMIMGQALGSVGLALIIRHQGFQFAAITQSVLLFLLTGLTFLVREHSSDAWFSLQQSSLRMEQERSTSLSSLVDELLKALVERRSLILFGAVAAVFVGERLFQRVFGLFLIDQAGWSDTDVSVLSGTYGTLAALTLALGGGWLSDRVGSRRLLGWMIAVMAVLYMGFSLGHAWWTDSLAATSGLVVQQIVEPLFSIAALPMLMGLCRSHVAGAQFAFYMALSNQADVIGIYLSGALYNQYPTWVIGLGCGLLMLCSGLAFSQVRHLLVETHRGDTV